MAKQRAGAPSFDFYFDDWLAGTFELPCELRGVLITVCALIGKTGNELIDDPRVMARWCGMSVRAWKIARQKLLDAGKISIDGFFIRQKRAETELFRAEKRRENATSAGRKGGEISAMLRKEKETASSHATNVAQPRQRLIDSSLRSESLSDSPLRYESDSRVSQKPNGPIPRRKSRSADEPDGFANFYAEYPKHEARGAAIRAWRTATAKAQPADIMAGLAQAKIRWERERTLPKYIPLPATWLNQERWADEHQSTKPEPLRSGYASILRPPV